MPDPAAPSQRVKLAAILRGSYLMSTRMLLQQKGSSVAYKFTLGPSRRLVWLTPRFAEQHAGLASVLRNSVAAAKEQGEQPKWTFLESAERFEDEKKKAIDKKRQWTAIGFATTSEKKAGKSCVHLYISIVIFLLV